MITADRNQNRAGAFTLVELLAVIVVIGILVATMIGVAKYAKLRTGVVLAKMQLATLQSALEMYKNDVGGYPFSSSVHFSGTGLAELSNSACLYRALTQSKRYYNARKGDTATTGGLTYFQDPWNIPWNYYHPDPAKLAGFFASINAPNSSYFITNYPGNYVYSSYVVGGQMNPLSYDLSSYGPDLATPIPGAVNGYWRGNTAFLPGSGRDKDDIVSWKRCQ